MKKTLVSFVLIGLIFFGFTLPIDNTQAAENIPAVNKVQITSIGDNEYINYGQGQKYRVYAYKNTSFKGVAYDPAGNPVQAGTTFYIQFDALLNDAAKKEILCTVGENGYFQGSTVIPSGVGQNTVSFMHSTQYYDVVSLRYYNQPNKISPIPLVNEHSVYHYAYEIYRP
ncbi:hypothetical protein C1N66_30625 [Bacillus cereus]|uniref:Group-specific protein n=1 Tax=Bacillus cereus TaxID=1396 RepID=A0AB73URL1_BACCE|nr:hypothetical protein [Bacillus cereus]QHV03799.1 hypothetical protein C1N82_11005 [Bacillus cereus]QHV47243.1 hypothetical protein C1N66_30625 [Bacillus cereus]